MPIANTSARNGKRIASIRATIEVMRAHPSGLSVIKLAEVRRISESAIKNYLRDMFEAGLVEKLPHKDLHRHPCALNIFTGTDAQIEAFIKSITFVAPAAGPKPEKVKAPAKEKVDRLQRDPARHFHIAADDEAVAMRVPHKKIPAPDPLLAAFFGRQVVA